jgi:predicted nucleic acid-binding Zn ribbon protein
MKNLISFDDAKDRVLGKVGTQRRDRFENELCEEIAQLERSRRRTRIVINLVGAIITVLVIILVILSR